MTTSLVLYTNPLSRGTVVHWMLEELGVSWRMQVLEYGAAMKSSEYLAINPLGKVPAIRHGEVVVTETAAICAYLADAFPEAGLAPPLGERGDYYRWLFFAAGPMEIATSLKSIDFQPTAEQQVFFGHGRHESVMDALVTAVKDKRYIAAGRFSAADIYVGSHLRWGMSQGLVERREEFEAYCQSLEQRPALQKVMEITRQAMEDSSQ